MQIVSKEPELAVDRDSARFLSRYVALRLENLWLRFLLMEAAARWAATKLKLQVFYFLVGLIQLCSQDSIFLFQLRDSLRANLGPKPVKLLPFRRWFGFFAHKKRLVETQDRKASHSATLGDPPNEYPTPSSVRLTKSHQILRFGKSVIMSLPRSGKLWPVSKSKR